MLCAALLGVCLYLLMFRSLGPALGLGRHETGLAVILIDVGVCLPLGGWAARRLVFPPPGASR